MRDDVPIWNKNVLKFAKDEVASKGLANAQK